MTSRRRPSLSSARRPSSAIFIGAGLPDNIPDLPEPPSPGTSSNGSHSGLPSPPGTNSTGSGSNGDVGSIRHRSASFANGDMFNGRHKTPSATESDDDDDNEDNTARFGTGRRRSLGGSGTENAAALQRIKSLNQRSRAVMDKLTSRSRVNSPAPSNPPSRASSTTRSPIPSSSSSTSSRLSPPALRRRDATTSGSETERESGISNHFYPSSEDLASTPPATQTEFSDDARLRRISMPSPGKHALHGIMRSISDITSPGRSGTPRKRASVALPIVDDTEDFMDRYAATAAGTSRRARQPLPREFLGRTTSDESVGRDSENILEARGAPSPHMMSPERAARPPRATSTAARSATVREISRKHQARWFSEDLTSMSAPADVDDDDDAGSIGRSDSRAGRRQAARGGSAESPLAAFASGERSLVGQGLRAAGIGAKRRESEDVFVSPSPATVARTRSTGTNLEVNGKGKGRSSLESDGRGLSITTSMPPRTPAINRVSRDFTSRPASAMARNESEEPPQTAPPGLRTYKSAYPMSDRERERGTTSVQRSRTAVEGRRRQSPTRVSMSRQEDRAVETPFRSGTLSRASGAALSQSMDHTRLMFNALNMFEDRLTHIPAQGSVGTMTIPEVFRSAKAMAQETEKLNVLLRDSTHRAMNEHIQASVDDGPAEGVDMAETWRQVSGDFRESLRVSDELVRMMTEFLLGVGKALRDIAGPGDSSPGQHLRSMSLDDDGIRRMNASGGSVNAHGAGSGEDNRSTSSRRSWEPAPRTASRLDTIVSRPSSSMAQTPQTQPQPRTRKISFEEEMQRAGTTARPASSARKLLSPVDSRDRALQRLAGLQPSDSLETVKGHVEPSPTPAARTGERTRMTSLTAPRVRPPPLPTLHSESRLERMAARDERAERISHRAKPSTASATTVRAVDLKFPAIKTALATTALSSTQSPVTMPSPLLRGDSSSSARNGAVAFSRPSQTALSNLQERQRTISATKRERTISGTSPLDEAPHHQSEPERNRSTVVGRTKISPTERNPGATVVRVGSAKARRRTVTEVFPR